MSNALNVSKTKNTTKVVLAELQIGRFVKCILSPRRLSKLVKWFSCSTDTPSTKASASFNWWSHNNYLAKLLLLMILLLLRLLIIVVVVGIFLVLLSRKNFQELFQAPASRLLSSLSSHLYTCNYYVAKKWKDCQLSSGKWSAGLGTARRWRVMLLSLQSIT